MSSDSDSDERAAPDPLGLDDEDLERPQARRTAGAGGDEPPIAAAPSRRGGRLLGTLALLLALGAAAGAGYLYYELIYTRDQVEDRTGARLADLGDSLEAVDARVDELAQRQQQALEELRDSQQQAHEALRERQETARSALEQSLRDAVAEASQQAPPSTAEWRRAEVQYLLRIANHRLLMERDVEGALRLLEAADAVLAQLDDFALHEVRAHLADEIAALENVSGTDLQGLFLRLEAAKRELDALPLRKPEYRGREAAPEPADTGAWATLKQQLANLVRVRELDGAVKPLLAPEEAVYLELNLRLMLERAQLAAVRGEQLMYEESLATALEWIDEYLDAGEPAVQRLREELEALAAVDLERPLPDVSGSLNALHDVLRGEP